MRIAPEGWPFILIALGICALLVVFKLWWPLGAWALVTIWVIAFFRDPARPGPRGESLIIAPADGEVVSIIPIDEPAYLGGPSTRISIFMNVFNVHVNRYPVDGTIEYRAYVPGKFINAAEEKAARENEQSSVGIRSARGPVLVRQIAGLVARRIITDHDSGTVVRQGERLGLIRFGSRVDVFVPPGVTIKAKVGDKPKAGQTVIAEWP